MRKGLFKRRIAAYVCVTAMVFCGLAGVSTVKSTQVAAEDTETAIQLDDAASGMNKTLHIDKASKDAKDGVKYSYQGFVTFKDLATKDFKYLKMTYTGDITYLRFEFNEKTTDNNQGPFWFDPNNESPDHFVTADGSEIPMVGNNTTIIIDLEKSGIDMSKYNNGIHMHGNSTTEAAFDVTLKDCVLTSVLPSDSSGDSNSNSNSNNGNGSVNNGSNNGNSNGNDGSNGNSKSAQKEAGASDGNGTSSEGGSTDAPITGAPVWPIAVAVGGIVIAGAAFGVSRKIKED